MSTRVRSVCLALAGLLSITAESVIRAQVAPDAPSRPTIGVVAFTNGAMRDNGDWEYMRQGLAEQMTTMLRYHPAVDVLEREQLQPILEEQGLVASGKVDPEKAARIGKLLGAQYMLLGTISIDPRNRLRLAARAVEVETSRILAGEIVQGDADDVMVLLDELSERLLKGLRLPPFPPRGNPDRDGSAPAASASDGVRASTPVPRSDSVVPRVATAEVGRPTGAREGRDSGRVEMPVATATAPRKGPLIKTTKTAAALNAPKGGEVGLRALRLMSLGVVTEAARPKEAAGYYRSALNVQPDLVAARDKLARLERQ